MISFWFSLSKSFCCSHNGILRCCLSVLHLSKAFAAVLLPESVSPVLNIPQMIFLKEPTSLFPKFVKVHYPHSTVMHLPLCEEEEWNVGSKCLFKHVIQTFKIWVLDSWTGSQTIVMLGLIISGLQNVKTIPHTLSHNSLFLCKNFCTFPGKSMCLKITFSPLY